MLRRILIGIDRTRHGVAAVRLGVRLGQAVRGHARGRWPSLMSPEFARSSRRGPWAENPAWTPFITWATKGDWRRSRIRRGRPWLNLPVGATKKAWRMWK